MHGSLERKQEMIDRLISNQGWPEADRPVLEALTEKQLTRICQPESDSQLTANVEEPLGMPVLNFGQETTSPASGDGPLGLPTLNFDDRKRKAVA